MDSYIPSFRHKNDYKEKNNNKFLPEKITSIYNQQWFPANPDCPNHSSNPRNSSFSYNILTNSSIQCMECLLNSTIHHHVHEIQACKIKNEVLIPSSSNASLHVFSPTDSNYFNNYQTYTHRFPVLDLSNKTKTKVNNASNYLNKAEQNIDNKVLEKFKTKSFNVSLFIFTN